MSWSTSLGSQRRRKKAKKRKKKKSAEKQDGLKLDKKYIKNDNRKNLKDRGTRQRMPQSKRESQTQRKTVAENLKCHQLWDC